MRKIGIFVVLMFLLSITFAQQLSEDKKKILIASPIRQKPAILKEFLDSLSNLKKDTLMVDYFFVDDNEDAQASELLSNFAKKQLESNCTLFYSPQITSDYQCNEATHYWTDALVWKVAAFKDIIINHAVNNKYDYLFLIDSDIVLAPKTVEHLVATDKEIIAEIFWTRWSPEDSELPQVWLSDTYNLYETADGERLSADTIDKRRTLFLEQLKRPGIYEVGGLGACTLIKKEALCKGLRFEKIKNITLWGEDRHFCVRAAALGISLFVDTHYPAYHIYRESHLAGLQDFKNRHASRRIREMVSNIWFLK
jgi:Anp1